eukprot:3038590-Amphidinium_carterae.1
MLCRGDSFCGSHQAAIKFEARSKQIMSLGYGTPRSIQLMRTLSIPILRHALSCSGVTPELRKTWNRVMALCLPGLNSVGPAGFYARELFGWLANIESLDSLAVRSAGGVLTRVLHRPTLELRRLQMVATTSAGVALPVSGWLKYGAWQAWADALTMYRSLKLASWSPQGLKLLVASTAVGPALLRAHIPPLATARAYAVRRIVQLWDGVVPRVQRFAEEAIHAIHAVARVGCPAESAAVLKLLTKFREMPVRDGQH